MIIHDLERNDLEIAIAKMNEAVKIFNDLAANSADTNFVAEMDETIFATTELTEKVRDIKDEAKMIDFTEYHERYLRH